MDAALHQYGTAQPPAEAAGCGAGQHGVLVPGGSQRGNGGGTAAGPAVGDGHGAAAEVRPAAAGTEYSQITADPMGLHRQRIFQKNSLHQHEIPSRSSVYTEEREMASFFEFEQTQTKFRKHKKYFLARADAEIGRGLRIPIQNYR